MGMQVTKIEVKGEHEKTYEIKRGVDGVVYCTCPSWRFQKKPVAKRVCKHMVYAASQANA